MTLTLNDIVNKPILLGIGQRLQKKNINVFSLYDELGIDFTGVEACKAVIEPVIEVIETIEEDC